MKDREWCEKIEDEINALKNRVNKLEGNSSCSDCSDKKVIELEIAWPEADIRGFRGLHFNAQTTKGVFELKEDGNYYSHDILFNSARDLDESTGHDLLSEYLEIPAVKEAFIMALKRAGIETKTISIFLPKENQGVKKYNGVSWHYWLKPRSAGSSSAFVYVSNSGHSGYSSASAVLGCAPAFCVDGNRHE